MEEPKLDETLDQIRAELHRLGLWQRRMPEWLERYEAIPGVANMTFFEWLQFIYLPNKGWRGQHAVRSLVLPQALQFLETVPDKGRLVQLLVELDALI